MPEYIEKLAAIHAIKNYGIDAINEKRRSLDIADDIIKLYDVIGDLPAADVVPVVHGEWVRPHWRNSNFCYDCSVCGNEVMHQEYRWRDKKIYPICPWCGAKMDGGADNG